MHPWCFIRVLAKEQVVNGIILPEIDQNKTVHEGIVLATWRPWSEWRTIPGSTTVMVHHESKLKPGDHVLFPHWAGAPIYGFKEKYYRVVKEEGWKETQDGGIFATVEYDDQKPVSELEKLLNSEKGIELVRRADHEKDFDQDAYNALARFIEDRFLLVDRTGASVTLSGR